MKYIVLLSLLISCTQKYQTYHVIDKQNFKKENYEVPITRKMLPANKQTRKYCAGQILFMSNAKKESDNYLSNLVSNMCGGNQYLLNARLTETWWTTLIYSRSCVELEAFCPRKVKNL